MKSKKLLIILSIMTTMTIPAIATKAMEENNFINIEDLRYTVNLDNKETPYGIPIIYSSETNYANIGTKLSGPEIFDNQIYKTQVFDNQIYKTQVFDNQMYKNDHNINTDSKPKKNQYGFNKKNKNRYQKLMNLDNANLNKKQEDIEQSNYNILSNSNNNILSNNNNNEFNEHIEEKDPGFINNNIEDNINGEPKAPTGNYQKLLEGDLNYLNNNNIEKPTNYFEDYQKLEEKDPGFINNNIEDNNIEEPKAPTGNYQKLVDEDLNYINNNNIEEPKKHSGKYEKLLEGDLNYLNNNNIEKPIKYFEDYQKLEEKDPSFINNNIEDNNIEEGIIQKTIEYSKKYRESGEKDLEYINNNNIEDDIIEIPNVRSKTYRREEKENLNEKDDDINNNIIEKSKKYLKPYPKLGEEYLNYENDDIENNINGEQNDYNNKFDGDTKKCEEKKYKLPRKPKRKLGFKNYMQTHVDNKQQKEKQKQYKKNYKDNRSKFVIKDYKELKLENEKKYNDKLNKSEMNYSYTREKNIKDTGEMSPRENKVKAKQSETDIEKYFKNLKEIEERIKHMDRRERRIRDSIKNDKDIKFNKFVIQHIEIDPMDQIEDLSQISLTTNEEPTHTNSLTTSEEGPYIKKLREIRKGKERITKERRDLKQIEQDIYNGYRKTQKLINDNRAKEKLMKAQDLYISDKEKFRFGLEETYETRTQMMKEYKSKERENRIRKEKERKESFFEKIKKLDLDKIAYKKREKRNREYHFGTDLPKRKLTKKKNEVTLKIGNNVSNLYDKYKNKYLKHESVDKENDKIEKIGSDVYNFINKNEGIGIFANKENFSKKTEKNQHLEPLKRRLNQTKNINYSKFNKPSNKPEYTQKSPEDKLRQQIYKETKNAYEANRAKNLINRKILF